MRNLFPITRALAFTMAFTMALALGPSASAVAQDDFEDDLDAEPASNELDEPVAPNEEASSAQDRPAPDAAPSLRDRLRVGATVAGGVSHLTRPSDPEGAPTLLFGSTFTGPAVIAGPTLSLDAAEVGPVDVSLELAALYGLSRGTGFAEDAARTQRKTVTLSTQQLRVPLMLRLTNRRERLRLHGGAGAEVLSGLTSAATVTNEGELSSTPEPLRTRPVTHIGLTGALGASWDLGRVRVPVEVRGVWNPSVGDSTRERFLGYESFEEPGEYEVAFDLQLLLTLGFVYEL